MIERLTKVTPSGKSFLNCVCPHHPKAAIFCKDCPAKNFKEQLECCPAIMAIQRLAAYEDTNLTPAEITAMQEENAELNSALEDEREHHNVYAQLMSDKCAALTKALEMALSPNSEHSCPSKNFKIAVECQNGWKADKKKCLKCWMDYSLNQARSAINSKEGEEEE